MAAETGHLVIDDKDIDDSLFHGLDDAFVERVKVAPRDELQAIEPSALLAVQALRAGQDGARVRGRNCKEEIAREV